MICDTGIFDLGSELACLDALRKADVTSYYKDKDALWVKVVSNGEGARTAGPGARANQRPGQPVGGSLSNEQGPPGTGPVRPPRR